MMNKFMKGDGGISLVEVLISMCIVALVGVSIIATVMQSLTLNEKTDQIYISSVIAQRRLDVLRKFTFSDLATAAPEDEHAIDFDDNGIDDFVRTTTIEEDYDSNEYLLKVKVSVDRIEDGSPSGNPIVMETLFADIEE